MSWGKTNEAIQKQLLDTKTTHFKSKTNRPTKYDAFPEQLNNQLAWQGKERIKRNNSNKNQNADQFKNRLNNFLENTNPITSKINPCVSLVKCSTILRLQCRRFEIIAIRCQATLIKSKTNQSNVHNSFRKLLNNRFAWPNENKCFQFCLKVILDNDQTGRLM